MNTLYIPDVNKWVKVHDKIVSEINPYQTSSHRDFQVGGNLGGRRFGASMIPIDYYLPKYQSESSNDVNVTMVSPAQQVVEHAKAELKRENNSSIKRQRIDAKK